VHQIGDRGLDAPNPLQIIIPNELTPMVIMDEQNAAGQRMLAFASEWALNFLIQHNQMVSIDGTFAVSKLMVKLNKLIFT
jgi:hypothetical protein